jgi:hypothetical protein
MSQRMSKMMQRSRPSRLLPFAVGIVLLAGSPVRAAGEDSGRKARERQARTACLAGDPTKGVGLLAELFVDTGDFNYIFNQARCFEQNHRYEDAISRFREFLKKAPNISKADHADVERQIAECQSFLQPGTATPRLAPDGTASPPMPQPEPTVVPAAAQPSPTPVAPAAGVAVTVPPSPAGATTSPGSGMRIAGIGIGAAGLVSIGAGVYFYTRAASLSNKISTSDSPSASDYQSGKTAQTMQWVFYGAGAAALATGSVLCYLGWSSSGTGQTAVAPMVGPGFAGITTQGAF